MSKLNKVQKAWSDKVGREIAFELRELEAHDGRKQTQLINPENGAVVVAVNATGADAQAILVERAGEPFIDAGFTVNDIEGPNQANQFDKSDNNVPVASDRPGPAVEAKKSKDADKLFEDTEAGKKAREDEDEDQPKKKSLKDRLTGK